MIENIAIGDAVIFTDAVSKEHKALVTAVWGSEHSQWEPAINIVFVSDDEARTDQYGRQLERHTSVVHKTAQPAHGMFWRRLNE